MHEVAVVADDLTGAMDTAHGFANRGYDAAVVADSSSIGDARVPDDVPVVAFNVDSRYDDPATAREAVIAAIDAAPARTVYKKVDSTLRGNLLPEVEAALEASGADLALVAPAFPAAGRTTEDGVHLVEGTPVTETAHADDPQGPASASPVDLFGGGAHPIEHVPLGTVAAGSDRVAVALRRAVDDADRPPIVVLDAASGEHLANVAAAGSSFDALYVGSGGLAEHVRVPGAVPRRTGRDRAVESGAPLGVVGSVNETTLAQLERVPDEAVVELDGPELVGDGRESAAAAGGRSAARRLADGEPAVLTGATDRADVERTVAAGEERGLAAQTIRERVAAGLATAARTAVEDGGPSGLVVTGGDVAVDVLRALDVTGVRLTGRAVEEGIPIGQLLDGAAAGLPFVTKAGGFGSEGAIVNCLAALSTDDE